MTRIIAGEARGRTIKVPAEGTRPTADRAREGLFSSLTARWGFAGSSVLDLFAGSGALGLEAASRGADEAVLVESSADAVKIIRHNMGVVKHPGVRVQEMKVSTYLASAPRKHFDLVLADPPYAFDEVDNETSAAGIHHSCLAQGWQLRRSALEGRFRGSDCGADNTVQGCA